MRTYKILIGYKKHLGEPQKENTMLEGIRENDLWRNVREIAKQGSPLYVISVEIE